MKIKLKKTPKKKDFLEIYGIHPVLAALKNNSRINKKLIISSNLRDIFRNFENKVDEIITIPMTQFKKIYGHEKNHQGVILKTLKLNQPNVDDIIKKSKNKNTDLILILDQVTDPQNIGSIMRSCLLFNCYSIIVAKHHSPNITSSMTKVAAGALESINYIQVANLSRVIEKFKKNNFWVVGFDNNTKKSNYDFQLPKKCLLIIGSEDKGLRKLTKKTCDQIFKIPINSSNKFGIESLNVSNACAIALYEHFKIYN